MDTSDEILENNKLIAEFMENLSPLNTRTIYLQANGFERGYYKFHELKYDSSWDWLMPVVEKIENIVYGNEMKYRFSKTSYILWVVDSLYVYPLDIKGVYSEVLEFIKFYNEIKFTNKTN